MKAFFNYYYEDAQANAEKYAAEHNGYIAKNSAVVDDRCYFEYLDEIDTESYKKAVNLCWSGETSAIIVRSNETYEDIAYFAGWISKADDVDDEE